MSSIPELDALMETYRERWSDRFACTAIEIHEDIADIKKYVESLKDMP